ncbi:MAG: hypothetical protein WAS07_02055 [Micropruina sp.]
MVRKEAPGTDGSSTDDEWDIGLTDEEAAETAELLDEIDFEKLQRELDAEEDEEAED